MTRRTRVLAAAVLVTAAVGTGGVITALPASASTCSTGSGVSVVVDFGALDGGVQTGCVSGGAGRTAASLFTGAGFDLSYVQNEPGFVCRISGLPAPSQTACVSTPPEDAYWALYWSDGTSGTWNYSNYGVGTLKVPDGGYVGFAWSTGSRNPPGLAPAAHATASPPTTAVPTSAPTARPTARPTQKPTSRPTSRPSGSPTTKPGSPSATASATTSATPSVTADGTTATPTAPTSGPTATTPSTEAAPAPTASEAVPSSDPPSTTATAGTSDPSNASGGALPAWVVPLVIVLLALAGAAVLLLRRRDRASP